MELTAKRAIGEVPTNPAVDRAHAGPGVLYFSRLIAKATASRLNKIVASPIHPSVTMRIDRRQRRPTPLR